MTTIDIQQYFIAKLRSGNFVKDKTGVKTIEMIGASFIADSPTIFGELNHEYIQRELDWYLSESLNVNDIPGKIPAIWKSVATPSGLINSNYGHLVFSAQNHCQYEKVLTELIRSPNSRRAVTIYTRPTMHTDWRHDGMSDFICTNAVQYFIRDGKMHCVVQMRSNDVWAGYRNDYAWQKYVLDKLVLDYNNWQVGYESPILAGDITWQVGSLHLYERQFYLVQRYIDEENKISSK
jgi:thymidylate synthase